MHDNTFRIWFVACQGVSVLFCGFAVYTALRFPRVRKLHSSKLAAVVCFVTFVLELFCVSVGIHVLINGGAISHDLCLAQSFVHTFERMFSWLWTACIAFNLSYMFVKKKRIDETAHLVRYYHMVSWPVACIFTALTALHYQDIQDNRAWCWINSDHPIFRFLIFYGILMCVIVFDIGCVITVISQVNKYIKEKTGELSEILIKNEHRYSIAKSKIQPISDSQNNNYQSTSNDISVSKKPAVVLTEEDDSIKYQYHSTIRKLKQLPLRLFIFILIFILCWLWGLVVRMLEIFGLHDVEIKDTFMLAHIILSSLQGFIFSLVFLWSFEVRREYAQTCRRYFFWTDSIGGARTHKDFTVNDFMKDYMHEENDDITTTHAPSVPYYQSEPITNAVLSRK